jgi:transcriptional regulator of arginine metabolism
MGAPAAWPLRRRVGPAGREAAEAMTAERRKRHLKILELISTRAIHTQEELADALAAEGWDVTQSSVSRDIATLRLIKSGGAYRRPTAVSVPVDPDERRIAEGALTIDRAGDALIVLHTPPGEANRVAAAIDRLAWPDVVGSLAGDDTIFLAVKDASAQRRVIGAMRKLTTT